MSDRRYHNVFTYYRGPSSRGDGDRYDQQLEDNATKALINTLELAGTAVTESFLRTFAEIDVPAADAVFRLQGSPTVKADQRVLVGLTMDGALAAPEGAAPLGAGRVDAAIAVPGRLLVVIETKIGDAPLDAAQLVRHSADWSIDAPAGWRGVAWPDVYRWARNEQAATSDPIAHFLLDQLVAFQRYAGLAPFTGFEEEDFAFFSGERNDERRAVIKARLKGIWQAVTGRLDPGQRAQLGQILVHNLRDRDQAASAQTVHADNTYVNLTIEITATEVQVNLVGWMQDQVARLEPWLKSPDALRLFAERPELSLAVYRRLPANHASRATARVPAWPGGPSEQIAVIAAPGFDFAVVTKTLAASITDGKWEKPGYHVRRSWPATEVVALGEHLADELAAEVAALLPIVHSLNAADRHLVDDQPV